MAARINLSSLSSESLEALKLKIVQQGYPKVAKEDFGATRQNLWNVLHNAGHTAEIAALKTHSKKAKQQSEIGKLRLTEERQEKSDQDSELVNDGHVAGRVKGRLPIKVVAWKAGAALPLTSSTHDASFVEIEKLAEEDKSRALEKCEAIIAKGWTTFVNVGRALTYVKLRRLYREEGYKRFEDYCRVRWGCSKTHANRQIQAANLVRLLPGAQEAEGLCEWQIRPLVSLPKERAVKVWEKVTSQNGDQGERVTGARVHNAIIEVLGIGEHGKPNLSGLKRLAVGKVKEAIKVLEAALKAFDQKEYNTVGSALRSLRHVLHPTGDTTKA
jgi:hypothetical protein